MTLDEAASFIMRSALAAHTGFVEHAREQGYTREEFALGMLVETSKQLEPGVNVVKNMNRVVELADTPAEQVDLLRGGFGHLTYLAVCAICAALAAPELERVPIAPNEGLH